MKYLWFAVLCLCTVVVAYGIQGCVKQDTYVELMNPISIVHSITGEYVFSDNSGKVEISVEEKFVRSCINGRTYELYFSVVTKDDKGLVLHGDRIVIWSDIFGFEEDTEISCIISLILGEDDLVVLFFDGVPYPLKRMNDMIPRARFKEHKPEEDETPGIYYMKETEKVKNYGSVA